MEIIYANKTVKLLENNKELPLDKVIIQYMNTYQLEKLHKLIGLITTKLIDYGIIIETLLETNENIEQDNDELSLQSSINDKNIEQINNNIKTMKQQHDTKIKEMNDNNHKIWIELLQEKKKTETMSRLVEQLQQENINLKDIIEENKKKELEINDYDMLTDVSYTC